MHSATTQLDITDAPAWARALRLPPADRRGVALVVADGPMQQRISETARESGREIVAVGTPFDAIQILQRRGGEIGVTIVASQPGWASSFAPSWPPSIRRSGESS